MADIRVLQAHTIMVNLHSDKFPVTATTLHDEEFKRHHFQQHMIHVTNPLSTTVSTSTQRAIPDEEMLATYATTLLLPPTQLQITSTTRCRHVWF